MTNIINEETFKKNVKYMVLWISNDCNLNCKYCYAADNRTKENMTYETAIKAINLPVDDEFTLILAGGEPTLNFSLVERIVTYIHEHKPKVKVNMQTNGTIIDDNMAKSISNLNIGIGVSFDGPIDVNEKLRGKTKDTIKGIMNLKNNNVNINLNAVVTNFNLDYLYKLLDLALYFENVNGIGLDLLRKSGNANKNKEYILPPEPEKIYYSLKKMYDRSKEIKELTGKNIIIREIEEAKMRINKKCQNKYYCYAAKGQSVVVRPNGDMYPCSSLVGMNQYFMGNIHCESSWNMKKIKYEKPKQCINCEYVNYCRGGCPSRMILNSQNGSISKEDCALRKAAFQLI